MFHNQIKVLWVCAVLWASSCGFDFSSTRSVLEEVSTPYVSDIAREGALCFGDIPEDNNVKEQTTDFLDMINFMEYVQTTTAGKPLSDDFMKYYELAEASMRYGNTFASQEHMARAIRAVNDPGRRKRSADSEDQSSAAALFDKFRNTMGEEKFKELLHLNRRVVMSFVIDTSSSMTNDMAQVREYIQQLVIEQENSGVQVEFCVTTFADPLAYKTETFYTKSDLFKKLHSLVPSIGGDCEEKTCTGIKKAIYSSSRFWTVRNSAMYVFTDASSKDCVREHMQIDRSLQFLKASAFFILFGSCKPNTIDHYYVSMAQKSGGFALLVQESGIYNITDTVNGAYDKDALIYGEESENTKSVVGQGIFGLRNKRQVSESNDEYEERSILIDTSIDRFKVFIRATPVSVLDQVSLSPPINGDPEFCGALFDGSENIIMKKSKADNSLVIDVSSWSCSCTGQWTLTYPRDAVTFDYKVHSSGRFLVDFEAYFVDEIGSMEISNYSPCKGIGENLVIKLNHGEKANRDSLTAKIVGLAGRRTYWKAALKEADQGNNAFVSSLVIPRDIGPEGFVIVLEGELINGVAFQRTSSTQFFPTGSCLRVVDVKNYYSIIPNRYTLITVAVSNNQESADSHLLWCENTMDYDIAVGGGSIIRTPYGGDRRGRSNPILLSPGETAFFSVRINAPRSQQLQSGRLVTVNCRVTTATEDLMEIILLTEFDGGI